MKLDTFSLTLIELSQSVGTESFYLKLKEFLNTTFEFDELLVLKFNKNADTKLHYRFGADGINNRLQGEDAWKYLTRLYVLDPYYRLFVDKDKFGFYALNEIAPDEFENLYHSYFNFLELSDEVGFLFPIDQDHCLHIDLSKFGSDKEFSSEDKERFQALYTPLKILCKQHIETLNEALETIETTQSNVEDVLLNFGKSILTNKEYQVCQLLLQGHSTKAIATIMSIGFETVKMHKKNIYGKTLLSSQSELLALFISILQQDPLDKDVDHLANYVDEQ